MLGQAEGRRALYQLIDRAFPCFSRNRSAVADGIFRVRRCAVVTLAIVLDRELPVAGDRVVLPMCDLGAVELIRSERRGHVALELLERRRVGCEVDEDESLEDPAMQPAQTQVRAVETLSHVRRCAQRAVEPVRPAVVAAGEARCMTCLVADPRAAMPAHV